MEEYRAVLLVLISVAFLVVECGKPNIVYILTDDQDIKLGSLHVQPNVMSMLTEQGVFFENAFVTTPVCCPSRSSILTGKFVHNHRTYENSVERGCDGQSWRDRNEQHTIGTYMTKAGYKTGLFGKYLNNYALGSSGKTVAHIPPGWTRWYGLVGNSRYYWYSVSNQGVEERHGANYTYDYFTDRVRDEAVSFIKESAKDSQKTPFFMYVSTPAPHRPATPAPQYADMFSNETAPRSPSYGYVGIDKHWIISKEISHYGVYNCSTQNVLCTPKLTKDSADIIDDLYRDRIRTLVSVDDLVEEVVKTLEKEGVLDNTYIIYNSDHGYHLGEFNQHGEKRQPYDENIRVPLIVRGPGVPKNKTTSSVALNIDMLPTFLDMAGQDNIESDIDGISFKPAVESAGEEKDESVKYSISIEYYGEGGKDGCMGEDNHNIPIDFLHDCHNNTFLALRTVDSTQGLNYMYARFYSNDTFPLDSKLIYFEEFYDLNKDPWQIKNINDTISDNMKQEIKDKLERWYSCSGKDCHDLRNQ